MDARKTLAVAGALIALATALGAFGAHALKAHLSSDKLLVYETAVRYHFIHALGLLAIGVLLRSVDGELLRWSATLVLVGIVLFSGSLYLLTFGAPRFVGIITPIGGLALIAGWILFATTMWRQ
ncbi:MAG: hypothetical protein QOI59_1296 [Gammaproteobacteria bacterium]|jgi:uncharacterized membrane protein YgdD (TMEM256/DUF423 family)|nr:hypothetical protein [Gammaproteobacteria bacterium]HWM66765.1 DUF423 domain-containing protein [Steroidobacteraceae bacterium]